MGYLAQSTLDEIQRDPALSEHYYHAVRTTFLDDLGDAYAGVPDELLRLMWCAMVAHHLKPYGPSDRHELDALLAEPHLDCDNYNSLAIRLYQLMRVNHDASLALLGWNAGAVGNHAQILAWSGSWSVLIDPTVCLYARTDYDDLVMGKPATGIRHFYWQWDTLTGYLTTVQDALANGRYRPKDCLYYFSSLERYIAACECPIWGTPQSGTMA